MLTCVQRTRTVLSHTLSTHFHNHRHTAMTEPVRKSRRVQSKAAEEEVKKKEKEEEEAQAGLQLDLAAEPSSWFATKEDFLKRFTASKPGSTVEVVRVSDGIPNVPEELREVSFDVICKSAEGALVDQKRVMFVVVGETPKESHICSHSNFTLVLWKYRLQSIDPRIALFERQGDESRDFHLLISTQPDAWRQPGVAHAAGPAAADSAGGGKPAWFYIGECERVSSTLDSPKHAIGAADKQYYYQTMHIVMPRMYKPDMTALSEHADFDPILKCTINRYGASLCKNV